MPNFYYVEYHMAQNMADILPSGPKIQPVTSFFSSHTFPS